MNDEYVQAKAEKLYRMVGCDLLGIEVVIRSVIEDCAREADSMPFRRHDSDVDAALDAVAARIRAIASPPPTPVTGPGETWEEHAKRCKSIHHNASCPPAPTPVVGTGDVRVRRVALWLCDLCLGGAGGECHVPGCALFLNRAPDLAVATELYEDLGGLMFQSPRPTPTTTPPTEE